MGSNIFLCLLDIYNSSFENCLFILSTSFSSLHSSISPSFPTSFFYSLSPFLSSFSFSFPLPLIAENLLSVRHWNTYVKKVGLAGITELWEEDEGRWACPSGLGTPGNHFWMREVWVWCLAWAKSNKTWGSLRQQAAQPWDTNTQHRVQPANLTPEDEVYRETIWPGKLDLPDTTVESIHRFPGITLRAFMSHFNIPHSAPDIMPVQVNTSRGTRTHSLPGKSESLLLRTILILSM